MRYLFILCILFSSMGIVAQNDTIKLNNPSFEDQPRQGGMEVHGIRGWYDCGIINFPNETPPDIHPKNYWNNTKHASNGSTYLGMVVRDNDSWESVSQRLSSPMQAGQCYSFSIELSQSKKYVSRSRLLGDSQETVNYTTPAVFRIWGGSGYCDTRELLGESSPVTNSQWKTFPFKLSPTSNHRYIIFEAFYKVPILFPYNGHILVDNSSELIAIPCSEEIASVDPEPDKKMPAHKRVKKKAKKKAKVSEQSSDVTFTKPAPKQKILNLDRNRIKKNQIIEIKNLYFAADTSSINEKSNEVLEEVFQFLRQNGDITIEIRGHTNSTPTDEYCDKLSTDRAKKVAEFLARKGIDGNRLTYRGLGKREPKATNRTVEGRKKNQRVEIKIISIG